MRGGADNITALVLAVGEPEPAGRIARRAGQRRIVVPPLGTAAPGVGPRGWLRAHRVLIGSAALALLLGGTAGYLAATGFGIKGGEPRPQAAATATATAHGGLILQPAPTETESPVPAPTVTETPTPAPTATATSTPEPAAAPVAWPSEPISTTNAARVSQLAQWGGLLSGIAYSPDGKVLALATSTGIEMYDAH